MVAFDFKQFMGDYSLSLDQAAVVFGVSRRTVTRWRADMIVPRSAWHMVKTIQRQSAPWSLSFRRSLRTGLQSIAQGWRVDLYGPQWQQLAFRFDQVKYELEQQAAVPEREAMRARGAERRRASAAKGAETRHRRRLAKLSAQQGGVRCRKLG